MIVYGNPLSPFVRKVLVYGEERGLGLELKMGTPGSPDPEFLATSPFAKIPGFRDGDFTISDSTAIIAYLEAKLPEGRLGFDDPQAIARTVWFEEFADTIAFAAAVPVFFNRIVAPMMGRTPDLAAADKAQAELLPPVFAYLEGQVDAGGAPLVGGKFGIADISVASILVNLGHCEGSPDAAKYPQLCGWTTAVHSRPSFAKWIAMENKMLGK